MQNCCSQALRARTSTRTAFWLPTEEPRISAGRAADGEHAKGASSPGEGCDEAAGAAQPLGAEVTRDKAPGAARAGERRVPGALSWGHLEQGEDEKNPLKPANKIQGIMKCLS